MLSGLEMAELPADAVEVGRVTDAWGVKGWFKVLPYSTDPEALFSSKRWFILPPERGLKTFDGCYKLPIKEARTHSDTIVASCHDVSDRTAAESLRGVRIFVSRSSFPTPSLDEYYWVDLIGLCVRNREGVEMGEVRELISTGPQTVLVLAAVEAGSPVERMIPFVSAYIDKVDLVAKVITVDWQLDY